MAVVYWSGIHSEVLAVFAFEYEFARSILSVITIYIYIYGDFSVCYCALIKVSKRCMMDPESQCTVSVCEDASLKACTLKSKAYVNADALPSAVYLSLPPTNCAFYGLLETAVPNPNKRPFLGSVSSRGMFSCVHRAERRAVFGAEEKHDGV